MKNLLKYRDCDYFNKTDFFIGINNLGQYYITDLEEFNGKWYPKTYISFKLSENYVSGNKRDINKYHNKGYIKINMTSIPSINCKEIYGKTVYYKGTKIKGKITNFMLDTLGINWFNGQGELFKKEGFPYFWNDIKNIELI